jgi:hypothetical protein
MNDMPVSQSVLYVYAVCKKSKIELLFNSNKLAQKKGKSIEHRA